MAFSLEKIFHDIVDYTAAEIAALEAHLKGHPNRKPDPAPEPAAPAEKAVIADEEIQKVVNGLENKLTAAENEVDNLSGQLKAATDQLTELGNKLEAATASLTGATEANTDLQKQVADLQAAVDAAKATPIPSSPAPDVTAEEAAKVGDQQPGGDNAFAGETGGTDGQAQG